ncbi:type III secretion system protein PrgE [Lactococcus nasutitermitis]|uniref:Type III secretion system protein PrgE n=1 Tax=Lactococcus nasutitermitis TaxID=1652957 RepID=A0ABV9JEI0_9LACT|nr:type III secretion system protein PrgE [Lactococcus nasutitermitis]
MEKINYQRYTSNREKSIPFEVGAHLATIKRVSLKETKSGLEKLVLLLEGESGETGFYYLTFNNFVGENLNLILTSIDDNGEEIPQMSFGYDEATAQFLTGKEVYIKVGMETYQGEQRSVIKTFLNQEEFDFATNFEDG